MTTTEPTFLDRARRAHLAAVEDKIATELEGDLTAARNNHREATAFKELVAGAADDVDDRNIHLQIDGRRASSCYWLGPGVVVAKRFSETWPTPYSLWLAANRWHPFDATEPFDLLRGVGSGAAYAHHEKITLGTPAEFLPALIRGETGPTPNEVINLADLARSITEAELELEQVRKRAKNLRTFAQRKVS